MESQNTNDVNPQETVLPWKLVMTYSSAAFTGMLFPLIIFSWIQYFYSPPPDTQRMVLISPGVIAIFLLIAHSIASISALVIGYASDKTQTKFGRRLPWIAIGIFIACIVFGFLWFPPAAGGVDQPSVIFYFALLYIVLLLGMKAFNIPLYSLLPELTRDSQQRIRLSTWMSIFEVLAIIVNGLLIAKLAGLGPTTIGTLKFNHGFEMIGIFMGIFGFAMVVPLLIFVREKQGSVKKIEYSFWASLKEAVENPLMVPFILAFLGLMFAFGIVIIALPFLVTQILGEKEHIAGIAQAILLLGVPFCLPVIKKLTKTKGKKKVFQWAATLIVLILPLFATVDYWGIPPLVLGTVFLILLIFPVAAVMVLPRAMIADIIDYDEQRTGHRREAVYTGGIIFTVELSNAFAFFATGVSFQLFGNSIEHSLGIRLAYVIAALGAGLALLALRKYSHDK